MNRLTLALVAALGTSAAFAMEKPYVGVDYQVQYHDFGGSSDVQPDAFRLRLGTDINSYLGVEAQIGVGGSSDSIVVDNAGTTWDVKTDSFYALFVKPQISIGSAASIFALAGGSYVDISASSNSGKSVKGFENGFAYGAGVDVNIYKGVRLGADYIQYLDSFNAVSVGIRIPLN
ncbi:MAG: porin family protein [Fluviicoccus sp.]|uniref:porin family protein n=1 Tax=Fluviicoccus sp. TaxID=2003552 RepID=UPI002725C5CA|nr:porin family protein [Fluviicoccus sp.]MDO8330125.1 porin family protein [Fluviicoccus sp.]